MSANTVSIWCVLGLLVIYMSSLQTQALRVGLPLMIRNREQIQDHRANDVFLLYRVVDRRGIPNVCWVIAFVNFLIRNNMHAEKCFFTCTAWWILKTEHTCWIVEIHSALHRNIATHCAQFCVHPPSLRIMLVGCTHYCRVWLWRVRSHCSAAFCCMHILQCIYPVYCWCVFGWFPVWSCYRPCCCEPFQCLCFGEQMYPFLFGKFVFGIHLVELLYHSW